LQALSAVLRPHRLLRVRCQMKPWPVSVLLAGCLALAGCRTDPNIVLLERELRLQEDRIYQLEDCVDEYEQMLESCRRELATLRRQLKSQQYSVDTEPLPPGGARMPRAVTEPARRAGTRGAEDTIIVKPPKVEPGQPANELPEKFRTPSKPGTQQLPDKPEPEPPAYRPEPLPNGAEAGYRRAEVASRVGQIPGPMLPGLHEPEVLSGGADDSAHAAAAKDSRNVASITLNPLLTGGYNKRRRSGSEGVMVVIQPRDAEGRLVEAPGEVSIAVIDPALEGPAGRIARWDFSADEIARSFRNTIVGRAIELEMPWPANPPQNDQLHLFVRYITSDGRKLHADRPIRVNPPLEVLERAEPGEMPDQRQPPAGPDLQSSGHEVQWRSAPLGLSNASSQQTHAPHRQAPHTQPAQTQAAQTQAATFAAGYAEAENHRAAQNSDVPPRADGNQTPLHSQASTPVHPAERPKLLRPVWTPDRR